MNPKSIVWIVAIVCVLPGFVFAGTVTLGDFKVDTTQQLLNLCAATPDDPFYNHAVNFCHGYLQGAYDYYEAAHGGAEGPKLVCFSDPPPTRNEAINIFTRWVKSQSQYWQEKPVNTFFRFLTEKWPCNP